jgi:tRNA (guanine37-N1)-methyltransferase
MTLFPEMCDFVLSQSIVGRARKKGVLDIRMHQIRNYAVDRHNRVDDTTYGGGRGMVMMPEPIYRCFEYICDFRKLRPKLIYMSPKGKVFNQKIAQKLASESHICILCGRYEGVDERVIDLIVDEQISLGDYVLTGGELPAVVLVDAVARLVPGVLSEDVCFEEESHLYNGKRLEYPQYTRPFEWRGMKVPEVLISGHHKNIKDWRNEQSFLQTKKHRPDLL